MQTPSIWSLLGLSKVLPRVFQSSRVFLYTSHTRLIWKKWGCLFTPGHLYPKYSLIECFCWENGLTQKAWQDFREQEQQIENIELGRWWKWKHAGKETKTKTWLRLGTAFPPLYCHILTLSISKLEAECLRLESRGSGAPIYLPGIAPCMEGSEEGRPVVGVVHALPIVSSYLCHLPGLSNICLPPGNVLSL